MTLEPEAPPADFVELSARIGADRLQVQAAGGNTSLKRDGAMWVKASGTMLADAASKDIFVAIDLAKAVAEIDGAGDGTCRAAMLGSSKLRPSIETTFHALLPQAVVLHTHSVSVIPHAASPDGRAALAGKLEGLAWAVVPYRRPGIPLAQALRDEIGEAPNSVYILANHGLIVAAETIREAAALLAEVEERLALPASAAPISPEPAPAPDGWHWVPECAPLACDGRLRELACAGSYYPDHVIFLGPALPQAASASQAAGMAQEHARPAAIVADEGVLLRRDASPHAAPMLLCLQDVLQRTGPDWQLDALSASQESELLGWDAEKYRQQLAAGKLP